METVILILLLGLIFSDFSWKIIILILLLFLSIISFILHIVAKIAKPKSVRKGYLRDNEGWKWGLKISRVFRKKNNLPIWVIPQITLATDREVDLLTRANLLYYEARSAIGRRRFSRRTKRHLLIQMSLMPQNIANALWKLANLRKLHSVTNSLEFTKAHQDENEKLQNQLLEEMEDSVEYLSGLSLALLKSEVSNDNKAINNALEELIDRNTTLEKMISTDANSYNKIRKIISFSYATDFILLVGVLTMASTYAPPYAFPIIVVGSILSFISIGVFQMRSDGKIQDASFSKILTEIIKNLRILR